MLPFQRLEGANPGVHVRHRDDPIEVVMVIRTGVGGQAKFFSPALGEAAPEKIADRDPIRLFVAQGLVHAIKLAQGILLAQHQFGLAHSVEHAHSVIAATVA